MTSPSRTSSNRSTPWVEGCCGPMLTVSSSRPSSLAEDSAEGASTSVTPVDPPGHREVDGFRAEGLRAAEGVAAPVVGHHDSPQIGVALKLDAEEVEQLALVPIGAGHERGDAGRKTVSARLE